MLSVSAQQRLWVDLKQLRVDKIADALDPEDWQRICVAQGAKGPRVYDWAGGRFGAPTETGLINWLLVRRSMVDSDERAYYFCAAPPQVTIQELAVVAGQRGSIECCFESAKQETGLDDYEVRNWHGWYRHITLSMLALALLTVIRIETADPKQKKGSLIWSR